MIPNEAVEAALLTIAQPDHWLLLDDDAKVRDILEAAAPHMLAAAWDAGREVGLDQDFEATTQIANPFRSQA